jgi:hypothetical protein
MNSDRLVEFRFEGFTQPAPPPGERHLRAFFGEQHCRRLSDSARPSGDQRDLAFEFSGH